MSYILDALRRADAERERGVVPGIHAQPVPAHSRDARGGQRTMKPWVGAIIGLSVVVLGAFAWHLMGREAPLDVAPSAAAPPGPAPATMPTATPPAMPPATAAPNPAATSPAAPPAVAAATPAPATKIAERPRAPASPSAEAARRKPAAPDAAPATVAEQNPARAATNSTTSGSEARVYALSELPQEIRRQLPSLAIGGSMYSETPSSRMLIVNGQLVHEGDALAPGLSLEQIKLKSAILRFKGYRYEISY